MSRRYKSATLQFGKPLALQSSKRIERCCAKHGKAFAHSPPQGVPIELLLINARREVRMVTGRCEETHTLMTDGVPGDRDKWKILGWRMADGFTPLGEYDAVDPDLAQFEFLSEPNPRPARHPI